MFFYYDRLALILSGKNYIQLDHHRGLDSLPD